MVSAKFKCTGITHLEKGSVSNVFLTPVYAGTVSETEKAKAKREEEGEPAPQGPTPRGRIELQWGTPVVKAAFEEDADYLVSFAKA